MNEKKLQTLKKIASMKLAIFFIVFFSLILKELTLLSGNRRK